MYGKALIATDLSDACAHVLRCAGGLRALGTTDIVLLHCFNIRDVGTLGPRLMELTRPLLDSQVSQLEAEGFIVTSDMVLGLPQIEIGRQAEERECEFIVVGSRGQSMSQEVLLGGVAAGVINSSTLPVLVVRVRLTRVDGNVICEMQEECDFLGHVLFATDFSDNAQHAFEYVGALAERGARRITLLHVQDRTKVGGYLEDRLAEFNRTDTERLQVLSDSLRKRGASDVRIEIPYGIPKRDIVERTKHDDVGLVVMGRQGRGFLSGFVSGSVSDAVVRHSVAPVLLVPVSRKR